MSLKNSKFKTIFCIMIMALTTCFIPSVKAATATASVDGTEYDTLQEAINNANGKTVTLLKDTTESITIGQDITVTLDLGKYTLTNSVGAHTIINKGILTINGNGVVDNISHGKGALVNNGTATIESGKLTRSMETGKLDTTTGKRVNGGNSWYVIDNNGANATLTIKGGEVVNTSEYSSLIRNLEASLTVTGGKLSNAFISLKNDDNGNVSVTGGEIATTGIGGSAVQNWGELTVTGGKLTASAENSVAIYTSSWSDIYNQPKTVISGNVQINGDILLKKDTDVKDQSYKVRPQMEINGGIINGDIEVTTESELTINSGTIKGEINQDTSNTIVITNGGSFTTEPDATEIPADKEVVKNDDGTYTIQYKSADYTKVDEAINKANALNKDEYTTDSIKKLENAINVVNRSKNITEQAEVDKMATDIEAAIASLEKKTAIENPKTYDGIATAIGLTGISLIGLLGIYLKTKKRFN